MRDLATQGKLGDRNLKFLYNFNVVKYKIISVFKFLMYKNSFNLSSQQKIDILLDSFDNDLEGLKETAKALKDKNREVRQAAFFLLSESEEEYAKQSLYNYLPFSCMTCSYIITDFRDYVECEPDFLLISNRYQKLIGYWNFDYPYFVKSWNLATGEVINNVDLAASEPNLFGLGKEEKIILAGDQNYIGKYHSNTLEEIEKFQEHDIRNYQYPYALRNSFAICPTNYSLVAIACFYNSNNIIEVKNYETYEIYFQYKFKNLYTNIKYTAKTHYYQKWLEQISCLIFSPDGKKLVANLQHRNRNDSLLCIWDIKNKEIIQVLDCLPRMVITSLGINPTGDMVACGIKEDKISVWDLLTNSIIYSIEEFAVCIISSDARILVHATTDHDIVIWDLVENIQLRILKGHTAPIMYLLISNDKEFVASYSIDKQIRIWSIM